jgi:hypothetical protein
VNTAVEPLAEAYVREQKRYHERQTTNAWLEHTSAVDEGPGGVVSPEAQPGALHEDGATYQLSDELPF